MLNIKDYGTKDTDLGAKAILEQAHLFTGAALDAGLFEGETHPDSEYTLAQIGAVHEFGSKDKRIPERSWLRRSLREKGEAWNRAIFDAVTKTIDSGGKVPIFNSLLFVGERIASDIRRTIDSVTSPPKAESTMRREGGPLRRTKTGKVKAGAHEHQMRFDHPLIWLGYMKAAVRSRIMMHGKAPSMTPKGKK